MAQPKHKQDLEELREILFGEQALQMEARLEEVEVKLNNLRRENRSLRQALEFEAKLRQSESIDLGETLTLARTDALNQLSNAWQDHLAAESKALSKQMDAMRAALDTMQDGQDETSDQMIALLQAQKKNRKQQFNTLKKALIDSEKNADKVTIAMRGTLDDYIAQHVTAHANGSEEAEPAAAD